MWDFFETVRHRHSIRHYQKDMPVEPEKLHALLEMAAAAPSAGDLQAYRIIVVLDPDLRQTLSEVANHQAFISDAPVCLVFCGDADRSEQTFGFRGRALFALQDATIAASYVQLAAVAAGLGTTWVGDFDDKAVSTTLDLESGLTPLALMSLGYAAETPEDTPRRPLDEVVIYRR